MEALKKKLFEILMKISVFNILLGSAFALLIDILLGFSMPILVWIIVLMILATVITFLMVWIIIELKAHFKIL